MKTLFRHFFFYEESLKKISTNFSSYFFKVFSFCFTSTSFYFMTSNNFLFFLWKTLLEYHYWHFFFSLLAVEGLSKEISECIKNGDERKIGFLTFFFLVFISRPLRQLHYTFNAEIFIMICLHFNAFICILTYFIVLFLLIEITTFFFLRQSFIWP